MTKISLVLSDVDGTLVTPDKTLTDRTCAAVHRLHERGIAFSVASSRPPFGLRMLVEPLALRLPMGAYNGGALVAPDLTMLEQRSVAPATACRALAMLRTFDVGIWVFSRDAWLVGDPRGPYIEREARAIQISPTAVESFDPHLDNVGKIVGVSSDFERLTRCEAASREALAGEASVSRSQPYYLDVMPVGVDKGVIVDVLARRLGIPTDEVATLGDMDNDIAMFRRSGFRIAMGNASPEVKRNADVVTLSNREEGFALAVEHLVLPRGRGATAAR
jgi:Cof subfamily protein (haloacid dehalogenase superfamily)